MTTTSRVAVVTGATQGLGLALVEGLARRLGPDDTVYLTGRDAGRVARAAEAVSGPGARVRGELLDVADPRAAARFAGLVRERHGGVDVAFSNAVMRIGPGDDPPAVIDEYTQVNNLGATRILRALGPLVRDGGRILVVASTLGTLHHLAPVLHDRFADSATLDEVDEQVETWRDAIRNGDGRAEAWPGFVNIPSKIALVAAVRALARERQAQDTRRGILVAAVCPGMINTPTSGLWWDVSGAPSPARAAVPLLDLALGPVDPEHYGALVRFGRVLPFR
ncbi:SDR family NAD(P)-dependent oxidoreductase [Nonomuraea sp. CA-218870]|uniref:SDR family NAD(P)-dependent oxidoreductase n=1 Tax=Nonomuraea sp. CA-218870 TaxID=3239998 RepID=UPI003D8E23A0